MHGHDLFREDSLAIARTLLQENAKMRNRFFVSAAANFAVALGIGAGAGTLGRYIYSDYTRFTPTTLLFMNLVLSALIVLTARSLREAHSYGANAFYYHRQAKDAEVDLKKLQ